MSEIKLVFSVTGWPCLVLIFGFFSTLASGADRPNVLLITADDLGFQQGCYGDPITPTPNLDALARRGRLFENAYVAQASCSPSRSAIFTGLYPHTNGQIGLANRGFAMHPEMTERTLPGFLHRLGYRTGILGKLHVAPESSFAFDTRISVDTRDVRATAAKAAEFLTGAEPFFLMANYSDPHVMGSGPRPPSEAFPTQYKGIPDLPLRVGEVPPLPFQMIDTDEQLQRVTQYHNAAMRFDTAVGLLLAEVDRAGHADNTIVLFISDHGPPFVRGKTSCYEGGVKVPMIVAWPNVFEAGTRSQALVSSVDLLPTILDAVGADIPGDLHGRSLRHTLDPSQHRSYLATEFHFHGTAPFFPRRAIRDARFKLIHNLRAGQTEPHTRVDGDASLEMARSSKFSGTRIGDAFERAVDPPEFELYDLQSDPWEFDDLAESADHADALHRLQQALLDWREETADPLLAPEGMAAMAQVAEEILRRQQGN